MNNTNQKELSKFGQYFLNFMNNKGGAQIFILTGLIALVLLIGPFFIQMHDILVSDANFASKALVVFGGICVVFSISALIAVLRMFKKHIK